MLGNKVIDGLQLIHLICLVSEKLGNLRVVAVENLPIFERYSSFDDTALASHIIEVIHKNFLLVLIALAPIKNLLLQFLYLHCVVHEEERENLVKF